MIFFLITAAATLLYHLKKYYSLLDNTSHLFHMRLTGYDHHTRSEYLLGRLDLFINFSLNRTRISCVKMFSYNNLSKLFDTRILLSGMNAWFLRDGMCIEKLSSIFVSKKRLFKKHKTSFLFLFTMRLISMAWHHNKINE